MRALFLLTVLMMAGAPAVSGAAEGQDGAPPAGSGAAYCAAVARTCAARCDQVTEPGSAASASCEARCAVDRTACEARDHLSRIEPWLSDKADQMDRFLKGFEGEGQDRDVPGAGPPEDPPTPQACREAHQACTDRCSQSYGPDDYARTGCDSVCAINRASCEASAGVEAARPFLEREAERLRDFFGGLLEDGDRPRTTTPSGPPSQPDPPPMPAWPERNQDGTLDL